MLESIRILYIGDLHRVTSYQEAQEKETLGWLERFSDLARTLDGFNLLICTGDLGHIGQKTNLEAGFDFMQKIRDAASAGQTAPGGVVIKTNLLITPGNHDVMWPDPDKMDGWDNNKRFELFVHLFSSAFGDDGIRPLLLTDDYKTQKTGHSPFSGADSRNLWWVKEGPNVLVLPLSSVDLSGTPIAAKYEVKQLQDYVLQGMDVDRETIWKRLQQRFTADIPFVDERQLKAFSKFIEDLNADDRAAYDAAVKIAVIHHPVASPLREDAYRPYPFLANGLRVLTRLQDFGFHLILHGHHHILGSSIRFGDSARYSPVDGFFDTRELVSVAGGHLSLDVNIGKPENLGFHVLTISTAESRIRDFRTISIDRHFLGQERHLERESLITVTPLGKARWLHSHNHQQQLVGRFIPRESDLVKGFTDFLSDVEERFAAYTSNPNGSQLAWDEIDRFISLASDSLREYARGPRGVSPAFIKDLEQRARIVNTRALIFVDHGGNGSWAQPQLMENAVSLFRIFLERNKSLLVIEEDKRTVTSRWDQGKWKHHQQIQEARERIAASGSMQAATPLSLGPMVQFDLARILVWRERALAASTARTLIGLHKVFDVPLFWVELEEAEEYFRSTFEGQVKVKDFHLEWEFNGSKPLLPPPTRGFAFDGSGRRSSLDKDRRNTLWNYCKWLMERCKDPSEAADRYRWLEASPDEIAPLVGL